MKAAGPSGNLIRVHGQRSSQKAKKRPIAGLLVGFWPLGSEHTQKIITDEIEKESGKTPVLGLGYKDAATGVGDQAGTWYQDYF